MANSSNSELQATATLVQRRKRSHTKSVLRSRYRGYCFSWRLADNGERRYVAADQSTLVNETVQETESLPSPSAQLTLNPLPETVDNTTKSALQYFIRDLIPTFSRRNGHHRLGVDQSLLHELLPKMLHRKLLLESIALMTSAIQVVYYSAHKNDGQFVDRQLLKLYPMVRAELSDSERIDAAETLVWSLTAICSTLYIQRRAADSAIHVRALSTLLDTSLKQKKPINPFIVQQARA
ncbi:hypothetical protein, variant [Exophiala mesophila]|nr:hypothetical protein, variant [Exophiala mesophila]KIV94867.1 hypothetical protein, variant [Exophiala mesophila]